MENKVDKLRGWFDGACWPNPGGHAAWGALLENDGREVWSGNGYVGHGPAMSNNVAEYAAVIALLEAVAGYPGHATLYGDSKLVVEQLNGRWRVNGGLYLPYYQRAQRLLTGRVAIVWIPREENSRADALSVVELEKRNVKRSY